MKENCKNKNKIKGKGGHIQKCSTTQPTPTTGKGIKYQ